MLCAWKVGKEASVRPKRSWGVLFFVFLYLIGIVVGSASDWTHNCPEKCHCTWIGGRKTAECRDAGLTSIPKGMSDETQVLDLRGNLIADLRKNVFKDSGLLNLHKIKMTNCGIQRVDRYAFSDLKLLVELDLSDNLIRELVMESFDTNPRLRELQLHGNPLAALYGTSFPQLTHFQKLSLRNCNLSTIPPRAFEKLEDLIDLDLSGNKLQTLSVDLFRGVKELKSISLHENPWRCDCKLKSFRDWALTNRRLTQATTCAQPERLANLEWSQLMTSHFACAPEISTLQISGQAIETYVGGDVGKTIKLECLVRANPPAEVRWVKDNISMTNLTATATGKSYYVHISGETERWVNLTIPNSHLSDAGDYTCVGENKGGSVEKNITLNFQDVPAGAGVGMGMGSEGGGAQPRPWLWILIGVLSSLLCLSLLVILVCYCSRKVRHPNSSRPQDIKAEGKLNGSGPSLPNTYSPQQIPSPQIQSTNQELPTLKKPKLHEQTHVLQNHISALIPNNVNDAFLSCRGNSRHFPCTSTSPCYLARRPGRIDGYEDLGQAEFELADVPPPPQQSYPFCHLFQSTNQFTPHFVPPPCGTYDPQFNLTTSIIPPPPMSPITPPVPPSLVNSETQTGNSLTTTQIHNHHPEFFNCSYDNQNMSQF